MVDLKPKIFQARADLLKVRVKLEEKSIKLEEKLKMLKLQKKAIEEQRISLDRKIEQWRSKAADAADSFNDMIAESDVIHRPTESDHNLIYCTIESKYIQLCPSQLSPVKTE